MKTIHIILTVIGTGLALVATVVGATWKISGDISRIETQVIQAREDIIGLEVNITGLEARMDEGFRQVGERFVQMDASILDLSTRVGRIEGRLIGRSGVGGSAPDDGLPPGSVSRPPQDTPP